MKEGLYDFKGFFEYHSVPSWIYDAAKNEIVELNLAAAKRYGYSREEFQQLIFFKSSFRTGTVNAIRKP